MKIAILTPTYNREHLLSRLYGSLTAQSTDDFVWIVVDDGSSDNTSETVMDFASQGKFNIRYFKKENGGKASALNYGFENNPDIDFFAVVDSDDWLSIDAVRTITKKACKYQTDESVGAIFFKYSDKNGKPLYESSENLLDKELCMTRYEHDSQYRKEDGCIGYYARATKKYKYPEYKGEKYMGPIVLQMLMAKEFSIAFTQEYVGYAEYQPGGLSKSGRKLRIQNPLGMIHYCGLLQSELNSNKKSRIKYCIEAQAYAHISGLTQHDLIENGIDPTYLKKWASAPGKALGVFWEKK